MADQEKIETEKIQEEPPMEDKQMSANTKSKWPLVVIGLLVLILIPLGGYFFYAEFGPKNEESIPTPTPVKTVEKTPSPSKFEEFVLDETYTSSEHGWQMDYSSDLKVTKYGAEQIGKSGIGEVVNFSFIGPTQKEGTEFYDGISMTIGVKQRPGEQTLEDFADNDTDIDPEIGSKTPMKEVEINGLLGFETTITGLGRARSIYLQHPKEEERVYYIGIFAEGPGESKEKYDQIVGKMLESFRNVN